MVNAPRLNLKPFRTTEIEYLVHTTNKKNLPSIRKTGLRLSNNPYITKGIYTFPDFAYDPTDFPEKTSAILVVRVNPEATYFYNGAKRPSEATAGEGNAGFKRIYFETLNELNLTPEQVIPALEPRKLFEALLTKKLREQGVEIYQSGGEIIILNPKVITSIGVAKGVGLK